MSWTCHAPHFDGSRYSTKPIKLEHKRIEDFALCLASHHRRLFAFLIRAGFVDSIDEGGDAFWRLDFWNSNHRRWLRERSK